jgi:hypothetical protein
MFSPVRGALRREERRRCHHDRDGRRWGKGDARNERGRRLHRGQDEATCVVFGMPKEAVKLGAVNTVAPLGNIAGIVMRESG